MQSRKIGNIPVNRVLKDVKLRILFMAGSVVPSFPKYILIPAVRIISFVEKNKSHWSFTATVADCGEVLFEFDDVTAAVRRWKELTEAVEQYWNYKDQSAQTRAGPCL